MTNAELNLAIAKLVYPDRNWFNDNGMIIHASRGVIIRFDFNNWNDLMPLVVEHQIELVCNVGWNDDGSDMWEGCHAPQGEIALTSGNNPQRALAECLLKVLEEKLRKKNL